ncbi:MAG: hypothetical protein ACQEVA_03070 [Myxococcota bacterium]
MPKLSIWAIRAACVHLVFGWTIGSLMLAEKGWSTPWSVFDWLPAHIHMLLFGWMVQLAFGVAYWMLPTFGRDRGRPQLAIAAVVFVNAAVALAVVHVFDVLPAWPVFAAEALAAVSFSIHAWPRIKAFGA